jgi:hypothetical protein
MLVLIGRLRRARSAIKMLPSVPSGYAHGTSFKSSFAVRTNSQSRRVALSPSARSAAHWARRVSRQSMRAFCDIARMHL